MSTVKSGRYVNTDSTTRNYINTIVKLDGVSDLTVHTYTLANGDIVTSPQTGGVGTQYQANDRDGCNLFDNGVSTYHVNGISHRTDTNRLPV